MDSLIGISKWNSLCHPSWGRGHSLLTDAGPSSGFILNHLITIVTLSLGLARLSPAFTTTTSGEAHPLGLGDTTIFSSGVLAPILVST